MKDKKGGSIVVRLGDNGRYVLSEGYTEHFSSLPEWTRKDINALGDWMYSFGYTLDDNDDRSEKLKYIKTREIQKGKLCLGDTVQVKSSGGLHIGDITQIDSEVVTVYLHNEKVLLRSIISRVTFIDRKYKRD